MGQRDWAFEHIVESSQVVDCEHNSDLVSPSRFALCKLWTLDLQRGGLHRNEVRVESLSN